MSVNLINLWGGFSVALAAFVGLSMPLRPSYSNVIHLPRHQTNDNAETNKESA